MTDTFIWAAAGGGEGAEKSIKVL